MAQLISKDQTTGGFEQWSLYICGNADCSSNGQTLAAFYTESGSSTERRARSTTDIADGNWHHYVMVADKTADKIKLYMDGIELKTTLASWGSWPTINNTQNLRIGDANYTGLNYTGQIDEVKIYNYALTPLQVKTEYNDGSVRFGP